MKGGFFIKLLHGISIAVYIVGQERRLVDPPSQVVAGVRTVTTNMNGRDTLPRCRAHSLFWKTTRPFCKLFLNFFCNPYYNHPRATLVLLSSLKLCDFIKG